MSEPVTIDRLGHAGDGIADTPGGPVIVPGALPGEIVVPPANGAVVRIETASADRREPSCRHFGTCGGCTAQHMSPELYATWKRQLVVHALRQQGIDAEVHPLIATGPGGRRRVTLAAVRTERGVRLGFRTRATHHIVALADCPVASPGIVKRLGGLARLAELILPARGELRLGVLDTGNGLDVLAESDATTIELSPAARHQLAELAREQGLLRVTYAGQEIIRLSEPEVMCAGVSVVPPAGGFLQAVTDIESQMAALILSAIGPARHVADLFCGVGTFTFALAARSKVLAIDSDRSALAALEFARRRSQGLKPIETRLRDLMREPLSPKELESFDAVIIDPPRAGAKAQFERLARAKPRTIVAVSCSPATLARDLKFLVDGGYEIDSVTPLDQFLWSPHVEAIAVLRRAKVKARR